MFGPQLPLTRKLWVTVFKTLQIKWEVKYFIKKSSCVFFPACVVYSCVFIIGRLNYHCIGMYPAYICIFLHESADDYITQVQAFYVSSHSEEPWYNETVCLWMTIYIIFRQQSFYSQYFWKFSLDVLLKKNQCSGNDFRVKLYQIKEINETILKERHLSFLEKLV